MLQLLATPRKNDLKYEVGASGKYHRIDTVQGVGIVKSYYFRYLLS